MNFKQWSESWLQTPGCAEFKFNFDRDASTGAISNLVCHQRPYNQENTPENRLRVQAFNIASLDENMRVIDVARVVTSDSEAEVAI